jgi:predicted nucleic-acid-binding protein
MIAADTNVIVRLLTRDDELQYKKAFALFSSQIVFIPDTVIQETDWVLRYAYEFSNEEICRALSGLFGLKNVRLSDPTRIAQAIGWHQQGLDFSDALHLAQSQECEKFFTFDKAFATRADKLGNCLVQLA